MFKRPLALVLVYVCLVPCVAAQSDQKRVRETAKMHDKIIKCATKRPFPSSELKLRNGTKLFGNVYSPRDNKFTFVEIPSHQMAEILYEDVSSVYCGDFTARMNRRAILLPLALLGIAVSVIAAAR